MTDHITAVLESKIKGDAKASELIEEWLNLPGYSHEFAVRLISIAQCGEHPWAYRILAVLLVQHQVFLLDDDRTGEFDELFFHLGLKPERGENIALSEFVLKEGFSSTSLASFTAEFKARLNRHGYLFTRIQGRATLPADLRDFLELLESECKLFVARYCFTGEDIIAELARRARTSQGVDAPFQWNCPPTGEECNLVLDSLPEYEADIVRTFQRSNVVFWASENTLSRLNGLIEYPAGTVVLVVKPPGSDLEIELKRAGFRKQQPITVAYRDVTGSHRLQGASIGWALQWEAAAAARFSQIYRLIHRKNLGMARSAKITSKYRIPGPDGSEKLMFEYLMDPGIFGEGFEEMRMAMKQSVQDYLDRGKRGHSDLPGELGVSHNFIAQYWPAQAVQFGSSSFRLDKLSGYLQPDGLNSYFEANPELETNAGVVRRILEHIFEETLGEYVRPDSSCESHAQYIEAVFSVPENRSRANANYLRIVEQIGKTWGTLSGFGGFSNGESFVARNVGIKSKWSSAGWETNLVFMDQDDLHLSETGERKFPLDDPLWGFGKDRFFIIGGDWSEPDPKSSIKALETIYRIDSDLAGKGRALLRSSRDEAFESTARELENNADLRQLFNTAYIEAYLDWRAILKACRKSRSKNKPDKTWQKAALKLLKEKGYKKKTSGRYVAVAARYTDFLDQ